MWLALSFCSWKCFLDKTTFCLMLSWNFALFEFILSKCGIVIEKMLLNKFPPNCFVKEKRLIISSLHCCVKWKIVRFMVKNGRGSFLLIFFLHFLLRTHKLHSNICLLFYYMWKVSHKKLVALVNGCFVHFQVDSKTHEKCFHSKLFSSVFIQQPE